MNKKMIKLLTRSIAVLLIVISLSSCSVKESEPFIGPDYPDDYSEVGSVDNYKNWGPFNLHDPSCIKVGEYYYVYSTDAIFFKKRPKPEDYPEVIGNIMVRRSKDLVNWEFLGWAIDSIPGDAVRHIKEVSGGDEPQNIWAPFIYKWGDQYRLYYAVSLFGRNTSYIGLLTSKSPEGPWVEAGEVVGTGYGDKMNAIDASVIVDKETGKHWMHYGSFFGGLYCVELNPETGLPLVEGDKGHVTARRADYRKHNLEAPEIIYNPELKKYFLFTSYDDLFTHYNVRVGRGDNPEGPFYDYFGNDLADTVNDYPVLTYAYRFYGHVGWAGVGHCAVTSDDEGNFFMLHQGRLAPRNLLIVLHVRKMFWTNDGWPVVSPERYAAVPQQEIEKKNLTGKWEILSLDEIADSLRQKEGQVHGGWKYDTAFFNNPVIYNFNDDGSIENHPELSWSYNNNLLHIQTGDENIELIPSFGWDWENKNKTIVITGIKKNGIGLQGKQLK